MIVDSLDKLDDSSEINEKLLIVANVICNYCDHNSKISIINIVFVGVFGLGEDKLVVVEDIYCPFFN